MRLIASWWIHRKENVQFYSMVLCSLWPCSHTQVYLSLPRILGSEQDGYKYSCFLMKKLKLREVNDFPMVKEVVNESETENSNFFPPVQRNFAKKLCPCPNKKFFSEVQFQGSSWKVGRFSGKWQWLIFVDLVCSSIKFIEGRRDKGLTCERE